MNDSTSILSDLNVLVVDDQETMRKIIRQLLKQAQIGNSFEAANGEEALKFIENIHEPNPDVVICDLHMDGMDGMEFVHRMRRKKNQTPILILTGDEDKFLREVTEQAGATRILTKPISAGDLAKEISSAVGFG
ncbi:MAG: response regulator [Rhodospirillales bacterium]|nr:response regulator [Rhodospirillales bacterium]MBT4627299.1 response regulator [Rhodospirillales bacterium]MBT5351262.1 response regulator [Rhodospirillales bacterium]MBT7147394.1 response regulator [Rhodospirillales bacterium]